MKKKILLLFTASFVVLAAFAWSQTIPQFQPIEYRLFNLSVLISRGFRAFEVNPFQVRFADHKTRTKKDSSSKTQDRVSLEIYYFPMLIKDIGPKNMQQFFAKVWPEQNFSQAKSGKNHGSVPAFESAIKFLQKKESFAGIQVQWAGFLVTLKNGLKTHVWLLHWQHKKRRYFVHINIADETVGLYQMPVMVFIRSINLIYRPALDLSKIDDLLTRFVYKGHNRMAISAREKQLLFHEPFFYQGQPMNVHDWLKNFSGMFLANRKWLILDQEALSMDQHQDLSAKEMTLLKTHLRQFSYTFTAGDIVAYLPAKSQNGKRLRWSYFLLKKVLGQWRVYGMGVEVLSTGKQGQDNPDEIIW